ncbi:STAS-like domain-containing protein [Candidatus Absconditicoccus praedator]|uniref:STAS-like domain-containing protein n=1 Tax=Candidatus Absconditicoccus praedator TaxID=2735562 RepID=UPI001E5E1213|nr:STAS-like domain-containing protein [Candidatus Absconditicoccus praedator]UFX82746.1 STAS-like domain-containing protein [Candidatus Absconditicoccus praedator]
MKTIKLQKLVGNVLVARRQAKDIFELAEKDNFQVEFDFEGVTFVSSSFADELFAKGFQKYGKVFKISNLDDDFHKNLIKEVIKGRQMEAA